MSNEEINALEYDEDETPEPLHKVLRKLPLFDNLYMNMQAMNIGVTDLQLFDMEEDLLDIYIDRERTPVPETIVVSAWSQMWIFAVYELLRTWRAQARALVEYGEELKNATAGERSALVEAKQRSLANAASVASDSAFHYTLAFKKMETDPSAIRRLQGAIDLCESVFRLVEMVRITLAKHEVPKTKGKLAMAPGYGRIGVHGSICWNVALKDGSISVISRRDISDELRELSSALDSSMEED